MAPASQQNSRAGNRINHRWVSSESTHHERFRVCRSSESERKRPMTRGLSASVRCEWHHQPAPSAHRTFDLLIRFLVGGAACCKLSASFVLGCSFQMARPYYDGMRNTTPNPHCSALSVFPRQQSPTIWKALIPQFLSFSSNGFLLCPFLVSFLFLSLLFLFLCKDIFLKTFCALIWSPLSLRLFFPHPFLL